jgi:hypothetical protein
VVRKTVAEAYALRSFSEVGSSPPCPAKNQESGIRNQESGIRNQESGIRNQESGIRNQESGVTNIRMLTKLFTTKSTEAR